MRKNGVFIKATLAKIKVFKGNFSKKKEGANCPPLQFLCVCVLGGGGANVLSCHFSWEILSVHPCT